MSLDVDVGRVASHKGRKFVMDYLDHHLLRLDRRKHVLAQRLLLHVIAELLGYLVADIGIEKCPPDVFQCLGDIYFSDFPFSFQDLEGTFESFY